MYTKKYQTSSQKVSLDLNPGGIFIALLRYQRPIKQIKYTK